MLNSKIEKLVFILVGYLVLCALTLTFPVENPSIRTQLMYLAIIVGVTLFLYNVYVKIRNNYILKQVRKKLESNSFDEALLFVDKCLNKNKGLFWLHYEKLVIIAMSGRISDFNDFRIKIKESNYIKAESLYGEMLGIFENIFSFLTDMKRSEITIAYSEDFSNLQKLNWLIVNANNIDIAEVMRIGNLIAESPSNLYKSVAYFVIAQKIHNTDRENSIKYFEKANEFAPSKEIAFCIEKQKQYP